MKFLCILLLPLALLANSPEQNSQLFGAFTLLPPFIAIVLAFVTKDVILSLFLGAMSGTFMLALVSNGYGASELIGAQNATQALADTLNNATQNSGKNSTNSNQNANLPKNSSQNSPTSTLNAKPQSIDNIAFFDPQTSGGLLCALPPQKAEFALDALQKVGINAHIIGKVRQILKDEKPFIRLA